MRVMPNFLTALWASLAQVHRARLPSGEEVAVKVQHKYVKKHSFIDIWSCDLMVRGVKVIFPQFRLLIIESRSV